MLSRTYIGIDLKSFCASVECVDRKLDPLTSNLVVADLSRTEKTICLAVSPALKGFGFPGRPRLFEVVEKVRMINAEQLQRIPGLPSWPRRWALNWTRNNNHITKRTLANET
jgi:DNA polymerase V